MVADELPGKEIRQTSFDAKTPFAQSDLSAYYKIG